MRYDMLTQELPKSVCIGGASYPINWDFRVGIQLDAVCHSQISEEEKFMKMLHLYYPRIPADVKEAYGKILWFYRCGETQEAEEAEEKQRYQRRKTKGPALVLSQDAPYIYAAFKEQYEIDLTDTGSLHWWKFMALLESLGENTKMSKIMYYRQASTSGMPKSQRAFINEMKKLYQVQAGTAKRTLEQRNQEWIEYVRKRHAQG